MEFSTITVIELSKAVSIHIVNKQAWLNIEFVWINLEFSSLFSNNLNQYYNHVFHFAVEFISRHESS